MKHAMTMIRPTSTFTLLLSMVVATGCGPHGPKRPSPEDLIGADPLPLALGASWQYKATVSQFDPEVGKDVEKELDWTTTVVEAHPIQDVTSFKLKGWPTDLVGGFQGAAAPTATEKTILRQGDTFLWSGDPGGTVDGAMGWFTWPLMDGQQICPDPELVYCWTVETTDDGYRLTYRTGPDEETYLLQPGTGVAEYSYVHHGTTLEVHARLVDYKEGKKGAMSPPPGATTPSGN
jgi:hypothetical protein